MTTSEIADQEWDAIIIGAGLGGGVIGRKLAESGLKTLFLEAGGWGRKGEAQHMDPSIADPTARSIRALWPEQMRIDHDGTIREMFGPLGSGVGGTSVFYASALERMARHDLQSTPDAPHPTGGWPIPYSALVPFYCEAEELFHACGERDPLDDSNEPPLKTPPALSPGDEVLMDDFKNAGLHPHRMSVGIKYIDGCEECIGHKCPSACKIDGKTGGVVPALATGNAAILEKCAVTRLNADRSKVTTIEALHNGAPIKLRGRIVVLAAGGFGSPRLLLHSASEIWPDGLCNQSDLVGRNLMFHANERIAIWPSRKLPFGYPRKSIAMRDFYQPSDNRIGLMHSMGVMADYGNILQYLRFQYDQSFLRTFRLGREFLRIPALMGEKIFGAASVFTVLLEDLPYKDNRVLIDPENPNKICVHYEIPKELLARRRILLKQLREKLGGIRWITLNHRLELNYGHPCGTLKFGTDPKTSVLDPNCKAHGLENLFVADSSFMPTSGGVNPSLTIIANALRVGEHIADNRLHHAAPPSNKTTVSS